MVSAAILCASQNLRSPRSAFLRQVQLWPLCSPSRGWIELFTTSKLAGVAGGGFFSFLVAIVAAYASYHLYEKQFLRLKRYFDYDRAPRAEALPFAAASGQSSTISAG
jgi:peptidoglycan/LPS O-acetylase OafA/YrhL